MRWWARVVAAAVKVVVCITEGARSTPILLPTHRAVKRSDLRRSQLAGHREINAQHKVRYSVDENLCSALALLLVTIRTLEDVTRVPKIYRGNVNT